MTTTALVFGEDDEETWKLLVSPSSDNEGEMMARLESLSKRFQDDLDYKQESEHWKRLCNTAQRRGFCIPKTPPGQLVAVSTKADSKIEGFPVAFQSECGKKHIAAAASLLGVSDRRAMQLTMSALRSVDSDGSQFQSLLGTRELLMKTMLYHFRQRFSRLSVLTECIRMEQDQGSNQRDAVVRFLDSLDAKHEHDDQHRGIFRRLLWVTCKPETPPTREQFQPAKELRPYTPSTLQESLTGQSGERSWNQFTVDCINARREFEIRERAEAMEALLVLLYERIRGGVKRLDYALVLISFRSSHDFFTSFAEGRRLCRVAGLICSECASLWRVFEAQGDDNVGWASQHPLLLGVGSAGNRNMAEAELESLGLLMKEYAEGSLDRNMKQTTAESPECLALLSFGLLLRLAYDSFLSSGAGYDAQAYWQTFKTIGTDMVRVANDECGAFEYLQYVMDHLGIEDPETHRPLDDDMLYDWQFSKTTSALIEDSPANELSDVAVAYTSIAREVLDASIFAFSDILSTHHVAALENIGLFCNLAAGIYRNNVLLCERFWLDWEAYTSPDPPASPSPMCILMDRAYYVAAASLKGADYGQNEHTVLRAIDPLLRLLSSLCYTSNVVELAIKELPAGLLRNALAFCRISSPTSAVAYVDSRISVLKSISILTRVGNSSSCREQFRVALEKSPAVQIDGPRVLSRILSLSDDSNVTQSVMHITANLLEGAPQNWSLQFARVFSRSQDSTMGLTRLLKQRNDTSYSAALVLLGLIDHLTAVVFCDSFSENDIIDFLENVLAAVLAASHSLVSSLSTVMNGFSEKFSPVYDSAQTILLAYTSLLKSIKTVIALHQAPAVRSAASEVRHALIGGLATSAGVGQAIAYYATAPVSLSVAARLKSFVDDASILQLMSDDGDERQASADKYGAWYAATQKTSVDASKDLSVRVKQYLRDLVSEAQSLDIDMEAIEARGWTFGSDRQAPLRAASSALRLLCQWAVHIEDMAANSGHGHSSKLSLLEDSTKDALFALSPQGLLASLANIPLPIRDNSHVSSAWASAGLSNLELLLLYVSKISQARTRTSSMFTGVTLDLIFACMVHVQTLVPKDNMADSALFQTLHRSPQFAPLIVASVNLAISISYEDGPQVDKAAIAHGLLSLRVLAICVKTNPGIVEKIFCDDKSPIVPRLTRTIAKVLHLLESATGDYDSRLFGDEKTLIQLRVATGCLSVILSLWTRARTTQFGKTDAARTRLTEIVEKEISLLKDLLMIVSSHASAVELKLAGRPSSTDSLHGWCVLLTFMSTALDILSTEMAWVLLNSDASPSGQMQRVLEGVFGKKFLQLPSMAHYFASCASCAFAAKASDIFRVHISGDDNLRGISSIEGLSGQLALLSSFPSTSVSHLETDFYVQENAFDVAAATSWVMNFQDGSVNLDDMLEIVDSFSVSHQLMSDELHLLAAWRRFVEILPFCSNGSRPSINQRIVSSDSSPSAGTLLELARETLGVLHENTVAVEVAQCEISQDFHREKTGRMTSDLAGLLLFFVDLAGTLDVDNSHNFGLDSLLDTLSLLTKTAERLFTVILSRSSNENPSQQQIQTCCVVEQPLLASAIVLAGALESRSYNFSKTQRKCQDEIYTDLARIAGKVLKAWWFVASEVSISEQHGSNVYGVMRRQYRASLLTCSSLLTVLITRNVDSNSYNAVDVYFAMISKTIREQEVLESLLEHANLASSSAASLRLSVMNKNASAAEDEETEVLKSIFTLINAFADVGDPQLLSLLASSRLMQVVGANPLFAHASNSWTMQGSNTAPRRGYIRSSDHSNVQQKESLSNVSAKSGYASRDDPIHDIWLTTMKILKASLRSSARQKGSQITEEMKTTFFNMTLEFLGAYRQPLTGCLKDCSTVKDGSLLTFNALREATNILSLVSELCTRPNRDKFVRSRPELYEEFINWSNLVVVSISKFLGASGTSRELFLALAEYDSSDSMNQHPQLAGGFANAKHEAIRYSHFASRCYARVTRRDFESSSIVPGHLKHLSQDREQDPALERNCRLSVTSTFILELEQVAAECLSQAISLIWQTHPAASCFVDFSESEARQLDAMRFVSTGMIIAFRSTAQRQFTLPEGAGDAGKIQFGKVLGSDSVNQTWLVRKMDKGQLLKPDEGQTLVVNAAQLAGIEDLRKRKCVAAYMPAPDSATELENASWGSLTLGHLILALRWCHQDLIMAAGDNQANGGSNVGLIQRIAEQITALLGAEMSIHDEIGSYSNLPPVDRARLDAQILELFGDLPEAEQGQNNMAAASFLVGVQPGRLKGILGKECWSAIWPQIWREVERARKDIEEKERKRREANVYGGSWYGSARRGSV